MNAQEAVRLNRVETSLGAVDLMHARYVTQVFAPHFHEGYCLGVIEQGALTFRYMGEHVVAPAGAVNLAIPGEVHTGQAANEVGWTYRMFYLSADLLVSVASQLTGKNAAMPFIRAGVLCDSDLARRIHQLHSKMEDPATPLLEKESLLITVLTRMVQRHSKPSPETCRTCREPTVVATARDFIHAHHDQDISIRELAGAVGLSPYHFIRVFREQTGLTPHAYLTQVRVRQAQRLIASGETPVQSAIGTGFFDQSHLTRHFKRITGITPGRYRNCVQDATLKDS